MDTLTESKNVRAGRASLTPDYAPQEVMVRYSQDGTIHLYSCQSISDVKGNIVDYLEHWAKARPDLIFLASRSPDRSWETITYAAAWARVQGIAQGLVNAGITGDRALVILSPASIEHGLVTLAGMLIGVPVAPVSPAYSALAKARPRLEKIMELLEPQWIFAQTEASCRNVETLGLVAQAKWLTASGGPNSLALSDWYDLAAGAEVQRRRDAVTPDTIAKILFTSGSTGDPKGVINTQGMLCSSVRNSVDLVRNPVEVPIVLDWMPWHHTMGGNAVLHGTLEAGGTFYIDDGRPTPELIARTLENIRDVRPTSLLSVPAAYNFLAEALEEDDALNEAFFSRMTRLTYAGASLPQDVFERITDLSIKTLGEPVHFGSALGTTETGPGILTTHWASQGQGAIGLPVVDCEVKLVPFGDRFELRVRGSNVTPGYYGRADLTAEAFDAQGFYLTGDLVQFMDPINPADGLKYAGRLSENFKLTNGSWVATGELRLAVQQACKGLITDLVLAGIDHDDVRIMVWPAPQALPDGSPQSLDALRQKIAERLIIHNASNNAATHRIAAFSILTEPPSLGEGEINDKGYINQRGVLARRADQVAKLYDVPLSDDVTVLPR